MASFKENTVNILRSVCGRRALIRCGRFLLNSGRLDGNNDMKFNGEFMLINEAVQPGQQVKKQTTVIDIGANVGQYSLAAAKIAVDAGIENIKVLSIEACSGTYVVLTDNIRKSAFSEYVTPLSCAISDTCGTAEFNVIAATAGRNSLLPIEDEIQTKTEQVEVLTLDQLFKDHNLECVNLVKIDTEGHDYAVLCGARQSLMGEKIGVIQFEYNWRWIEQRAYLRDVFRLVSEIPYSLGKVTPQGIELFEQWCPQLETLTENNYALVRNDLISHFTQTKTVSTC